MITHKKIYIKIHTKKKNIKSQELHIVLLTDQKL